MARRRRKIQKGTLFIVLLLCSLFLLFLKKSYTSKITMFSRDIAAPILNVGKSSNFSFFRPAPDASDMVQRNEHEKLMASYANLLADLQTLNNRFDRLADFRNSLPEPAPRLIQAQVTQATGSDELFIDKGSEDGVWPGQYVFGGQNAVIGTISEISTNISKITLVSNPSHTIEVKIYQNEDNRFLPIRIMRGIGRGLCNIKQVSTEYKVTEGDLVYAAAKRGFILTERVIGIVSYAKEDDNNPLLWDIKVTPFFDKDNDYVWIAVMTNQEGPE